MTPGKLYRVNTIDGAQITVWIDTSGDGNMVDLLNDKDVAVFLGEHCCENHFGLIPYLKVLTPSGNVGFITGYWADQLSALNKEETLI